MGFVPLSLNFGLFDFFLSPGFPYGAAVVSGHTVGTRSLTEMRCRRTL